MMRMYQVDYFEDGQWHMYLCAGTALKKIEQREYLSFLAEGRRIPKKLFHVHRIEKVDGYTVKLVSPRTAEKERAVYEKSQARRKANRKKKELEQGINNSTSLEADCI